MFAFTKGDRGQKGDKGDTGIQGVKGDKGDTGDTGTAPYVDRGDSETLDFQVGSFTRDNTWRELDLTGIIPVNCVAVEAVVTIVSSTGNQSVYFRSNGFSSAINIKGIVAQVAGYHNKVCFKVAVGANCIIDYKATSTNITLIELVITGWWL